MAKPETSKTIDQEGREVLDPARSLMESTLAVDLARAEIDQAIATAHKYPRVIDTVIKQIETMATYNEAAAENCIYSLPRGGKPLIGASIGFANILAAAWGNCVDGGRPTYVDRKEKTVYAEGVFHDLQTNRRTIIHESRRISGKTGALFNDDMIIVTGKAAAAIARRNAILNAVPRAIWHPIWEQALRIVRGDQETFAERKDKALKAFAQFGVKPEQIYMVLGLKGDPDLTLEHIPMLRGMYLQLRDGVETVETMFDPRRMTGKGFEQVENPLGEAEAAVAAEAGEEQAGADVGDDQAPPGAKGPGTPQAAAKGPQEAAKPQAALQAGPQAETAPASPAKAPEAARAAAAEPEPKPAKIVQAAEPEPAAAGSVQPKTEEEYLSYWEGFCSSASSVTVMRNQWSKDRSLRTACRVIGDHFNSAKAIMEGREAQLREGGK